MSNFNVVSFQDFVWNNHNLLNLQKSECGSVFFQKDETTTVYCTPFWEDSDGVEINVVNDEGEILEVKYVDFQLSSDDTESIKTFKTIVDTLKGIYGCID
jgi:hypothetical protein